MKYHVRACALLLATGVSSMSLGAPAQIARMGLSAKTQGNCIDQNCTGSGKATISVHHAFQVPPEVIEGLQSSSQITIMMEGALIEFTLGDDPNYTKGATSANVRKTLPFNYLDQGTVAVIAQLNWSSNSFQVVLKGKATGKGEAALKKADKQVLATNLSTLIETPNVAGFEQKDEVPVDYTATGNQVISPTGTNIYKETTVIKTVELVK